MCNTFPTDKIIVERNKWQKVQAILQMAESIQSQKLGYTDFVQTPEDGQSEEELQLVRIQQFTERLPISTTENLCQHIWGLTVYNSLCKEPGTENHTPGFVGEKLRKGHVYPIDFFV